MKSVIVGVLLLAGVVVALDAVAGPFFSLAVRTVPPTVQGERVIGGVEGPVKSTDEDVHVVNIASGFLGLWSLPIAVTPETTIAVDGKLGGWGDLRPGLLVRVMYEVAAGERRVASRVEVLDPRSPVAAVPGSGAGAGEPPVPRKEAVSSPPALPHVTEPAAVAAPRAVAPEPSAVAAPRAVAPEPAALTRERPARLRARRKPANPPALSLPPAPEAPPATFEDRPAPGERSPREDGVAAVDWLLKEGFSGR
jgi:hypothetical protein